MIPFIVLSGGVGQRMGGNKPKQYQLLEGKPILYYTIKHLVEAGVDSIILVLDMDFKEEVRDFLKPFMTKITLSFAPKGETRRDSVESALNFLETDEKWVAIHDGVRPFVTQALIQRLLEGRESVEAVIPGLPVTDTLKKVTNSIVDQTVDRSEYQKIETPQIVHLDFYRKQLQALKNVPVTDDASLIELGGGKVRVVSGEPMNIKITTPFDLILGAHIIRRHYESRNRL